MLLVGKEKVVRPDMWALLSISPDPRFSPRRTLDSATDFPHSTSQTMADADEEAIRATSTEAPQIETDLSDETQDFRLLNHLNLYLPKAAMLSRL